MVSPLWIASTEGDLAQVELILKEASVIDIEIKDETGASALVQAVRNSHEHVVRALLGAGADPAVSSAYGELEQLATDAAVLELVKAAKEKKNSAESAAEAVPQPDGYPQEYSTDPSKAYYAQPNGSYMYYPPYPGTTLPDGTPAPFYPPPPPSNTSSQPSDGSGGSNLPPPEIARFIPCRYFPACRYGPSCMFQHPTGPYFQSSMPPPAQYHAPYDPMAQPPYGGYYPVPQAHYGPGGVPQMPNAMSPPPAPAPHQSPSTMPNHVRNASEVVSHPQVPFSPSARPPPMPFTMPMPATYSQPGQGPHPSVPVGMPPFLPPAQQGAVPPPQPNGSIYSPTSPVVQSAGPHRREPSLAGIPNGNAPHTAGVDGRHDVYMNGRGPRNGMGHARRESMRRGPQTAGGPGLNRRPPCAFFPTGRCRNGDSCKFPHVLPDGNEAGITHIGPKFGSRNRAHTHEPSENLHEKMAGLDLRTDAAPHVNGNGPVRPRHHNGYKPNGINGSRYDKQGVNGRHFHVSQQRVPGADEFPVLGGSITPPGRSPAALTFKGPTAAQVLQAPPPRKDSARSPTLAEPAKTEQAPLDVTPTPKENVPNGHVVNGINGAVHELKPLTFAAVATVAAAPPESVNTVSVSA